jgi:hypothetical protein
MSSQPEIIGDYTEAQFHANNLLINKTLKDVEQGKQRLQGAFMTMARLAGKLNAHLFQCHFAHINRGIAKGVHRALGDAIAKYDPAQPEALIANITAIRGFMENHVPELKEQRDESAA